MYRVHVNTEKVKLLYHDKCVTFVITLSLLWATARIFFSSESSGRCCPCACVRRFLFFESFSAAAFNNSNRCGIFLFLILYSVHSFSKYVAWRSICKKRNCDVKWYDENDNYIWFWSDPIIQPRLFNDASMLAPLVSCLCRLPAHCIFLCFSRPILNRQPHFIC